MLVKKRVFINRQLESLDTNVDRLKEDLTSSFVGHQFVSGLVDSFELHSVGASTPCPNKDANTLVAADVTFNILSIPPGFIIAGATIMNIKQDSNNVTYILSAPFFDIDGKQIGVGRPMVIGFVTTMNKPVESLNIYKRLVIGSKVALSCISNIFAEGKMQPLTFNAEVIEHVNPKCFTHNSHIDVGRIKKLATKQKVNYPLFEHHAVGDVELVEGRRYCMSIYGFTEHNGGVGIDFITLPNTVRRTGLQGIEHEIGIDTLSNYLYYTMCNWTCALKALANE
jgi:hypothetical protein